MAETASQFSSSQTDEQSITHRITIAWSVSECALGGVMHAIQSPFTGLFVGGLSVLFISLIAFHSTKPAKAIFQAVAFVLAAKLTISPHAPLGAFFAVGLQALIGAALFQFCKSYKAAAFLSATISLSLSAVQKIIILTLLFGSSLWSAVDQFNQAILLRLGIPEVSFSTVDLIIGAYIALYFIAGMIIGFLAASLPKVLEEKGEVLREQIGHFNYQPGKSDQESKWRKTVFFLSIALMVLVLEYFFLDSKTALMLLARLIGIITFWLIIIRPGLTWMIKRILKEKQVSIKQEIEKIQMKIPVLARFGKFAWNRRHSGEGFAIVNFFLLYLFYTIYEL